MGRAGLLEMVPNENTLMSTAWRGAEKGPGGTVYGADLEHAAGRFLQF